MDGQLAACAVTVDVFDRVPGLSDVVDFGYYNISDTGSCRLADQGHILFEERTGDVMDAHADPVETVVGTVDQLGHQLCVAKFVAGGGAVFAVEGDVEDRAKLLLQGHRFTHQLVGAGVMIADRQIDRTVLALE